MRFLLKTLISALVLAAASELSRKSALFAAILISLPLTSILALTWVYRDTGSSAEVSALSTSIFWMIPPSLVLFLVLPLLLKSGVRFSWAMLAACASTALTYVAYSWALRKIGISL